jgi:hypothetical protein
MQGAWAAPVPLLVVAAFLAVFPRVRGRAQLEASGSRVDAYFVGPAEEAAEEAKRRELERAEAGDETTRPAPEQHGLARPGEPPLPDPPSPRSTERDED